MSEEVKATQSPWKLVCNVCGWSAEECAAMQPKCPNCSAGLNVHIPPYDDKRTSLEVLRERQRKMSEEKITGVCLDIPTVIAEAKSGGWIGVAERLPEDKQDCVLHCVDTNYSKIEGEQLFLDNDRLVGRYVNGYGFLVYGARDWFGPVDVLNWMPLPDVPSSDQLKIQTPLKTRKA